MIKPSEIDTTRRFMGSSLRNHEKEVVARNIAIMSQVIAEAKKDDRWHPFSQAEYEGVRTATSDEPVNYVERNVLSQLVETKHLSVGEDGSYSVTNDFLGVMVQFA